MFKLHPITTILNLLFVLLITIFAKSNIVFLIICILLLLGTFKHKKVNNYILLILFLLIINIICGKPWFISRIMFFIGYFSTTFVDYDEIDFIRIYDTLCSSYNIYSTKIFLKIIYFKKEYAKNFNTIANASKSLGFKFDFKYFVFSIEESFSLTRKSLNKIIKVYEKRFYFNANRNKYKIVFSFRDIMLVLVSFVTFVLVIMLGV